MLLKTPKVRMAILLSALTLVALYNFFSTELLLRLVFMITYTLSLEYALWKIRGISPFIPSAAIVTALIIFLLFDNISPFYYALIPLTLAVMQKQFLRLEGRHIFNPATFGLYVAGLVGYPTFWWGISWGPAPLIVTILGGIWVTMFTLRQHFVVIPYILASVLVYIFLRGTFDLSDVTGAFLAGSFWFFTFIMLPEPITAPHKNKTRILYALFVALLPVVLLNRLPGDIILLTLLLGNLLGFVLDKYLGKVGTQKEKRSPQDI